MVSWSYNHCHVHNWVCYRGVCRKVANPYAKFTLFEASGYCGFWWYLIRKVWSVDHIIIVMFIIECAIRGSAEMSQIHTQWWHFSTAVGYCGFWWYFIRKIWSVDHIIIVMFIIECAIGGLQKCPKSIRSGDTFWQRSVTVDFYDILIQKYGQLII